MKIVPIVIASAVACLFVTGCTGRNCRHRSAASDCRTPESCNVHGPRADELAARAGHAAVTWQTLPSATFSCESDACGCTDSGTPLIGSPGENAETPTAQTPVQSIVIPDNREPVPPIPKGYDDNPPLDPTQEN